MQLNLNRFKELGASVLAIAPETREAALSTARNNDLGFDVLSDMGNGVARKFGIVFQLPEDLRPVYADFGIDLAKANNDESFELPIPATYVIGPDRKIRKAFVNPDYTKRLDPEDIIVVLKDMAHETGGIRM